MADGKSTGGTTGGIEPGTPATRRAAAVAEAAQARAAQAEVTEDGRPVVARPRGRLNIIGFAVLMANFCALYGALGVMLHFPSMMVVSAMFGLLSILYVALNPQITATVLGDITVWGTLLVGYVAPLLYLVVLLADRQIKMEQLTYWIAFNLSFAAIFLNGVIFGYAVEGSRVTWFAYLACLVIAGEFVSNAVNYNFTMLVLDFSSSVIAKSESLGRFMGFFGIFNTAAYAVFLAVFLAAVQVRRVTVGFVIFTVIAAYLIFLTQSRTALIMMALVLAWLTVRALVNRPGYIRIGIVLLPLMLAAGVAVLVIKSHSLSSGSSEMMDRFTGLLAAVFADGNHADESSQLRVRAISQFMELISLRPFTGYGLDVIVELVSRGDLVAVSQNAWIEWAAEFGVTYPVLVAVSLLVIYIRESRASVLMRLQGLGGDNLRLFIVTMLISSLSIMDFYQIRPFAVAFGLLLGQYVRNRKLAQMEAEVDRATPIVSITPVRRVARRPLPPAQTPSTQPSAPRPTPRGQAS